MCEARAEDDKGKNESSMKGESMKESVRSSCEKAGGDSGKKESSKKGGSVKEGERSSGENRQRIDRDSQNANKDVSRKQKSGQSRGRDPYKQTDLKSSLRAHSSSRSRSETPKRPFPGDCSSPESTTKKRATGSIRRKSDPERGD